MSRKTTEPGARRGNVCQRTRDRFPAGYVHVEGDFAAAHRAEIVDFNPAVRVKVPSGKHASDSPRATVPGEVGVRESVSS